MDALGNPLNEDVRMDKKVYFYLAAPAIFDLAGTILSKIGLLFTTVSVFQMCRGGVIVFGKCMVRK